MTLGRTIPANVATTIDDQHTKPFYIVKAEFSGGTKYMSEAQQVTFETQTYLEGKIKVGSFSHDSEGGQRGTIAILNDETDYAYDIAMNNTVQDVPVSIYLVYSTGPATNADPVLYVKGYISGAEIRPDASIFEVFTSKSQTEFVPNRFHTIEEGFNWLPPHGLVIQWNNEKYMLESE